MTKFIYSPLGDRYYNISSIQDFRIRSHQDDWYISAYIDDEMQNLFISKTKEECEDYIKECFDTFGD